jgi:hypothetical protein
MSDQPQNPTGQQAGQPAAPAQGEPGTAQPGTDPAEVAFREFQSRADKYAKSVEERLKRAAAAFEEPVAPQPAQAGQPNGNPSQASNAETQWARNVEATFGVTLDMSDPEAALLIEGQTPLEYKRAYLEAMRAKKARLSQAPAPAAPTQPAPPITPTTAGGGAPAPKPDAMQRYQAEVSQPGLTKSQRLEIRRKYRDEEHLPI